MFTRGRPFSRIALHSAAGFALIALALLTTALPSGAASSLGDSPQPSWQTNDRVRAVVVSNGVTYLGGYFTQMRAPSGSSGTQDVQYLAAIDNVTGDLTSWAPQVNGHVWALAASPDGATIYIGGEFTTVNGVKRPRIAAVDAVTGAVRSWHPVVNRRVRAIVATNSRVYIGGTFTKVSGQPQAYVAALDTGGGSLVTDWRPLIEQYAAGTTDPDTGQPAECPPRCPPEVASLELSNTGDVYIGGHFGIVNGTNRDNVAEVDAASGATMAWDPSVFQGAPTNPNQKNYVYDISASPSSSSHPDRVFICGDFWRVHGVVSANLAAVDATTGTYDLNWRTSTDGGTPSCWLGPDDTLYIGGHFRYVGGVRSQRDGVYRSHVAALSASDGEYLPADPNTGRPAGTYAVVDAWNPGANSVLGVHAIGGADGLVAVAGDFTRIGQRDQQGIALFR